MIHWKPYQLLFLVLVALLTLFFQWEDTWADTISIQEYQTRIQKAIDCFKTQDGEILPEERSWLKETFPDELHVQDKHGETILLNCRDILFGPDKSAEPEQNRAHFIVHLKALHQQLSVNLKSLEEICQDWEQHRKTLDEVYRLKEFQHLKKMQEPVWMKYIEDLLKSLGRWIKDNIGVLDNVSTDLDLAIQIFYGAILFLSIVIILWVARLFGWSGWQSKELKIQAHSLKQEKKLDWASWREDAQKKALDGTFRDAIRSFFVSVLMQGHEQGWWIYEPEATNSEHMKRLEMHSERSDALKGLIDIYEKAWYGMGDPGKDEFQKCEQCLFQMEETS